MWTLSTKEGYYGIKVQILREGCKKFRLADKCRRFASLSGVSVKKTSVGSNWFALCFLREGSKKFRFTIGGRRFTSLRGFPVKEASVGRLDFRSPPQSAGVIKIADNANKGVTI
jgi:hypothetical protein